MTKQVNTLILCSLVLFLIYCSLKIGIHWDELNIIQFGNDRLKYLFSFGENEDYAKQWNSRFYPGAYSTIAIFFTKFFPTKYELEVLRIINIIFGFSAIIGITKITEELFNKNIGKITFVICFLNPHFFGHIIMNERDLIVAFCNIWSTYLIIKYIRKQNIEKKRNKIILLSGLTIGLGMGVRFVFFATLIPVLLFIIIDIFFLKKLVNKNFSVKKLLFDSIKIFLIAYLVMIAFWPHTHGNIFILPFQLIFESFSTSQIGAPLGLVNGDIYFTKQTPKYYILTNLFHKLPEFVIFSYLILFILLLKNKNYFSLKFNLFYYKISLIIFIIIFPNLVLFVIPYSIYDGLRQFLYIIPYICIIPGLIIYYLFNSLKEKINKFIFGIIALMFVYFAFNFISLTPYQYTYLNILNGKFNETYTKYENDYWGISLKELIHKIPNKKEFSESKNIKIASCGVSEGSLKFYLSKLKNISFDLVYPDVDYDYIIMTNRVIWSHEGIQDLKKAEICYEKYKGEDVIAVNRKGLLLSTIRKKVK